MGTKDFIKISASNNGVHDSGCEPSRGDLLRGNSKARKRKNERMPDNIENEAAAEGNSLGNHKEEEAFANSHESNPTALSGTKQSQTTVEKQQPSVHVIYSSLTRESRQKLEELLQQWSQWHARHSSSSNDSSEVLESGEEIYFPALHIGLDKASAVTFWMDNQTKNPTNKEITPLDGKSVPLYDRGYSLALASTDGSGNLERGFEVLHAPRCFNCGSYSHPLKECPKPRDNAVVNNARKEHSSGRNHIVGSRNPTRYYQNTPKGKFDGLRPGVLDAETRKVLGLGELDPPPWLNRMREIGYPPGYLDPEDEEDQPSGITIFADEESKEKEEGKMPESGRPEPPKKMSAEFPGMNAPIPEKANRRHWEARSPSFNLARHHPYRRYDHHPSESINRGGKHMSRDYQDFRPPGGDHRSERYPHSPYGIPSPSFGRFMPATGRRSPLTNYDYSNLGRYGSLP